MASLVVKQPGLLSRLWASYEHQLQKRPVATNMATSAVLWGAGDLLAQRCANKESAQVDMRRTALTAAFGGSLIGPIGHLWYDYLLDWLVAFFGSPTSMRGLIAKVVLDNTLYSSFYMLAFFAFGELVLDRGTWDNLGKQLKTEFLPTYLAEVCAWPPIMFAIFSKLPPSHHLLTVNLLCVLDVAFLAVIRSGAASLNDIGKSSAETTAAAKQKPAKKPTKPAPPKQRQPAEDAFPPGLGPATDMLLMPALASVHSGNTAGSNRRKAKGAAAAAGAEPAGSAGAGPLDVVAGHAAAMCGHMQQVISSWVPALHRP